MGGVGFAELLIFVVVVVAVIGLVVAVIKTGGASATSRHHSAIVSDATPEAFIRRAAAAAAGLPKHTLSGGVGCSTLIVTRSYVAAWRILVAVLLFPIGLIALIGKDHETATIAAAPDGGRTRVTLDGAFSGALIDRINAVLN